MFLHNLADAEATVDLATPLAGEGSCSIEEMFRDAASGPPVPGDGPPERITLPGYGYRWFRVHGR